MGLIDRVRKVVDKAWGPSEKKDDFYDDSSWPPYSHEGPIGKAGAQEAQDPRSAQERAFVGQNSSETEEVRLRRRCDEYFRLIERIEVERDEAQDRWMIQSSEHQNAQAILETRLIQTRQIAQRAVMMLNAMRKEQNLEPIKVQSPSDLDPYDGEPVGMAEAYAKRMKALNDDMPRPVDALKARDEIDSGLADD